MLIKTKDGFIDPGKEPVVVVFFEQDKKAIKQMSKEEDMYITYPNEMSKEEAEEILELNDTTEEKEKNPNSTVEEILNQKPEEVK